MTKWKIIGTIFALGLTLIGITLWRVDKYTFQDRVQLIEAQMAGLTAATAQAVASEGKSLFGRFIPAEVLNGKSERLDWSALTPYDAFFFTQNPESKPPKDSKLSSTIQLFLRDQSQSNLINVLTIEKAIGILPFPAKSEILLRAFSDANRNKHIIFLVPSYNRWFGFVSKGDSLQSLIEKQKTQQFQLSIINPEGVTIANTIRDYVGSRASDNPLLDQIYRQQSHVGKGFFKLNAHRTVFASYEKIPGIAGYVISNIPQSEISGDRLSFHIQSVLLCIGVLLFGVSLVYTHYQAIENSLQQVLAKTRNIAIGAKPQENSKNNSLIPEAQGICEYLNQIESQRILQKKTPSSKTPSPVDQLNTHQMDMNQVYQKVASALGHEFRGPLTGLLGDVQGIIAKATQPEISQIGENLVLKIRNLRGILDKLFLFSGDRTPVKKAALLESPLTLALKSLEPQLIKKGVRIVKEFGNRESLPICAEDLQKAFEAILINAMEAMERMARKEISIKSYFENGKHFVIISDTGEGIDPNDLPRIFDPFFTSRSFSKHIGLGLSVAMGIVREHGGNIVVESILGKGTQVTLSFDPSTVQVSQNPSPFIPKEVPKLPNKEKAMIDKFIEEKNQTKSQPSLDLNIDCLLEELPEKQQIKPLNIEVLKEEPIQELKPIIPTLIDTTVNSENQNKPKSLELVESPIEKNIKIDNIRIDKPPAAPLKASLNEIEFIEDDLIPKPKQNKSNVLSGPKPSMKKRGSKTLDQYKVSIRKPEKGN